MAVTCIFGMQWGDEGKGRLVDLVARRSDIVVRYQGGANAGHTVIVGDQKYVLHMLPSGSIQSHTRNVIANGVVVDPWTLLGEIDELAGRGISLDGRLFISDRAHVVLPYHFTMDRAMEKLRGERAIGTTSRGIGPTYGDKAMREGLRISDLIDPSHSEDRFRANLTARNEILRKAGLDVLDAQAAWTSTLEAAARLEPYVADTTELLLQAWDQGAEILLEGAQGYGLDLDHGSYPFVTSSHTGAAGVAPGTGLPPQALDRVVGVLKAYVTRVGAGPFPTRDEGDAGRHLAARGHEFGATTGRPRDCGWFDAVTARRAARTQGVTELAIMKLDVLSGLAEIRVATGYRLSGRTVAAPPASAADWAACRPVYESHPGWEADLSGVRRFEDLPEAARRYVARLQDLVGVPVGTISVGPERDQFIETPSGAAVAV